MFAWSTLPKVARRRCFGSSRGHFSESPLEILHNGGVESSRNPFGVPFLKMHLRIGRNKPPKALQEFSWPFSESAWNLLYNGGVENPRNPHRDPLTAVSEDVHDSGQERMYAKSSAEMRGSCYKRDSADPSYRLLKYQVWHSGISNPGDQVGGTA